MCCAVLCCAVLCCAVLCCAVAARLGSWRRALASSVLQRWPAVCLLLMLCMLPAAHAVHCREVTGFRAPHFKTNNLLGQVLADLGFQ